MTISNFCHGTNHYHLVRLYNELFHLSHKGRTSRLKLMWMMERNYQITSFVDGTNAPTDPIDLCVDFFEQKSAVNAQIHLLQTLTATFRYAVSVSSPPHHRTLPWELSLGPSWLSQQLLFPTLRETSPPCLHWKQRINDASPESKEGRWLVR